MENKKVIWILFLLLILVSGLLHIASLSYPDRPVFDESHFATYASGYASRSGVLDIHPPLGKLLFAAALRISGEKKYHEFVQPIVDPSRSDISIKAVDTGFHSFPYIEARLVSAVAGTALTAVFFFFIYVLTGHIFPAVLGAFFLTFENALLLQSRLILLDVFMLLFGFSGLAFLLVGLQSRQGSKQWWWFILSGVFLGAALNTKWIAFLFILVSFLAYYFFYPHTKILKLRSVFLPLISSAVFIYLAIFLVHTIILPPEARLAKFSVYAADPSLVSSLTNAQGFNVYLSAALTDFMFGLHGYFSHQEWPDFSSPWFFWPLMWKPIVYWKDATGSLNAQLILLGNPVIWWAGLLAIVVWILKLVRSVLRRIPVERLSTENFLTLSWAMSLIPFAGLDRPTYLYHSLIALLFSIAMLAVWTTRILKDEALAPLSFRNRSQLLVAGLIVLSFFGFLAILPFTYGITLPNLFS